MSPPRYVMIGGFLGAGKTTAVGRLGAHLREQGLRVGLITNDQGTQSTGLVDTGLLRQQGFAVEEITGGCFCCRFDSLREAAEQLTASAQPEVFIAEPVGSCTDLVATVSYPLRRLYGDSYRVAPLSVVVDPMRAARVLGLTEGRRFSDKVAYVFLKQLEEAALLVINKVDTAPPELVDALQAELQRRYAGTPVLRVSCATGEGLPAWFAWILREEAPSRPAMEVDYVVYAEGEALLGWLNATVRIAAPTAFEGDAMLRGLATELIAGLGDEAEIAHLKLTLDPQTPFGELAAVSVVDASQAMQTRTRLPEPVRGGQIVVNLRAEVAPERGEASLRQALATLASRGFEVELEHLEAFRPSPPVPTHRDGGAP